MDTTVRWVYIDGFPGYEVSESGDVRRIAPYKQHPAGHLLKPKLNVDGYRVVTLYLDRKAHHKRIARLVASAFIGPTPSASHVAAHWDGNKLNDHVKNLRWATASENEYDKARQGLRNDRRGEAHQTSILTDEIVRAMRIDRLAGMRHGEIASKYVVAKITAYDAVIGKTWVHITDPAGVQRKTQATLERAKVAA